MRRWSLRSCPRFALGPRECVPILWPRRAVRCVFLFATVPRRIVEVNLLAKSRSWGRISTGRPPHFVSVWGQRKGGALSESRFARLSLIGTSGGMGAATCTVAKSLAGTGLELLVRSLGCIWRHGSDHFLGGHTPPTTEGDRHPGGNRPPPTREKRVPC